jgi:hypothetical protein
MGQAVAGIPPSGYSNMAAQDPGFVDRVTARMQALINDPRQNQLPDQAYGRASSFERGNQGIPDDETSAWDIAKAMIKTPFALLNAGRDALQDTLGVGGAQYRQRQRDELQALQNLPQAQRQILGIDNISGISTPGMQAGDMSGTAGAPSSLGSNAGSTMKGYVEWANNVGKDRAEMAMNQVRATIKAQFAAGKITAQELDNLNAALTGYRTAADTNRINAVTTGQLIDNAYAPRLHEAELGVKGAQIGAYNSTTRQNDAQTQTINELRPSQVKKGEWDAANAESQTWETRTRTFYAEQKGEDEHRRELTLLPLDAQKTWSDTVKNVAAANKDMGVYGASGSGNTGENSATANIFKSGLQAKQEALDALAGNGKNGRPAQSMETVGEFYGIPKVSKPRVDLPILRTLFGSTEEYDPRSWDPTKEARDSLVSADKKAAGQAIAIPPMPSIDQPAVPAAGRATGDDINRVYNILKGSSHGGYSESERLSHAETLAGLARQFSDANEEEFATKAFEAKVPIDLIELYWKSTHGNQ